MPLVLCCCIASAIFFGCEMTDSDERYTQSRNRAVPAEIALKAAFEHASAAIEQTKRLAIDHDPYESDEGSIESRYSSSPSEYEESEADLPVKNLTQLYMNLLNQRGLLKI